MADLEDHGDLPEVRPRCRAAQASPPPVPKAMPSALLGGRTERHGLSSPIAIFNAAADRRAKSDGVPRWGCLVAPARPVTPTRRVQRLSAAVEFASRVTMAALSRGRI